MGRYDGWITDVKGVQVGHWTDTQAQTGCTVVMFENGAVGGIEVRGAAPGTRETDLLRGYHCVDKINAIMLSGGSAFGLAAADGAMRFLDEQKIGFQSEQYHIPIVPAAVLFDLSVGNGSVRPDAKAGYEACLYASDTMTKEGRVGVGTGATIGKMYGMQHSSPGGIGTASIWLTRDVVVSALVAVNAVGNIIDPRSGRCVAGCRVPNPNPVGGMEAVPGSNTTIGIVATNAALTREECNRMAEMGQDGLVLAIRPVHTPYDGDTIFGAATCDVEIPKERLADLFVVATEVMARAVLNAIWAVQGEQ